MSKPTRCISPAAAIYVPRALKYAGDRPILLKRSDMAEIFNIRDYQRREEREASLVRLAKEVMGLIDTSPSEMPPVQPNYQAPEQDPA